MKKSRQLIGTGIVDCESGMIIGNIKNTVFFPCSKKILGFCVDCGRWVKHEKIIQVKYIKNIGNDMVMVKHDNILEDIKNYPEFINAIDKKNRIFGLKVITSRGQELGYIEDIIINQNNFYIEGYVLTDGIIEDITKGKSVLSFSEKIIFGEDTIILDEENSDIILKNDMSLKKVFRRGE